MERVLTSIAAGHGEGRPQWLGTDDEAYVETLIAAAPERLRRAFDR